MEYRDLEVGDVLREGDQYDNSTEDEWLPVPKMYYGGIIESDDWVKYQRPLKGDSDGV